jgi:hypothetical protein
MENAEPQWRSIVGYEDVYEVSTDGDVRSLDRVNNVGCKLKGRPLKVFRCIAKNGGRTAKVQLCDGGIQKTWLVSTLVMETFVGPKPVDCTCVVHADGDGFNVSLDNLSYGTRFDVKAIIRQNGNEPRGEDRTRNVLTEKEVREIRLSPEKDHIIAPRYGVGAGTVWALRSRVSWAHVV